MTLKKEFKGGFIHKEEKMYKTILEKMKELGREISIINSVKFESGVSYAESQRLSKKAKELLNKYRYYQYMLGKR